MGKFVKGEIVVFPFPFSDLSGHKLRPALVVANLTGDDMVLCMISKQSADPDCLPLTDGDFTQGNLPTSPSYIRPTRLFTGHDAKVVKSRGQVSQAKLTQVTNKLIQILMR